MPDICIGVCTDTCVDVCADAFAVMRGLHLNSVTRSCLSWCVCVRHDLLMFVAYRSFFFVPHADIFLVDMRIYLRRFCCVDALAERHISYGILVTAYQLQHISYGRFCCADALAERQPSSIPQVTCQSLGVLVISTYWSSQHMSSGNTLLYCSILVVVIALSSQHISDCYMVVIATNQSLPPCISQPTPFRDLGVITTYWLFTALLLGVITTYWLFTALLLGVITTYQLFTALLSSQHVSDLLCDNSH